MDLGRLQKELKNLRREAKRSAEVIGEKNEEIENMLKKLGPLLEGKGRGYVGMGDSNRASLSMLEVFLKKYKINVF